MTKVLYDGKYIELKDELEPGYKELDLINEKDEKTNKSNEYESKDIDLDDTIEINLENENE